MPLQPIFVHAWWRSASTYVWTMLRRDERLICYYEPLHERLATLTAADVDKPEPEVSRALRHPPGDANYFAEYGRLLRGNELGYSRDLAYARFLLRPEEQDVQLQRYLQGLVASAGEQGRRPVLCFCRSQMRSAWMRRKFDALHVTQVRNPIFQFDSFGVAPYFLNRMVAIAVRLCQAYPEAFSHLPGLQLHAASTAGGLSISRKESQAVFALLWTASTLQAVSSADFILDVDRLSVDARSRRQAHDWFFEQGCELDFDDCRVPGAFAARNIQSDMQDALDAAVAALRGHAKSLVVFDRDRVSSHLDQLAPVTCSVLEGVLAP